VTILMVTALIVAKQVHQKWRTSPRNTFSLDGHLHGAYHSAFAVCDQTQARTMQMQVPHVCGLQAVCRVGKNRSPGVAYLGDSICSAVCGGNILKPWGSFVWARQLVMPPVHVAMAIPYQASCCMPGSLGVSWLCLRRLCDDAVCCVSLLLVWGGACWHVWWITRI
jgi:hypothetical protein